MGIIHFDPRPQKEFDISADVNGDGKVDLASVDYLGNEFTLFFQAPASSNYTFDIRSQDNATARSQIMDTDMAAETAEFARLQILQKAGIAVLSQANMNSNLSLKLLENL